MNILIIGSGAREHVFFHKLLESKSKVSLFSINPNAAISSISTALHFDFNFQNLKHAIIENSINLVPCWA
jgi:phosphoribosylamine-glycine ligase